MLAPDPDVPETVMPPQPPPAPPISPARARKLAARARRQRIHLLPPPKAPGGAPRLVTIGGAWYTVGPRGNLIRTAKAPRYQKPQAVA